MSLVRTLKWRPLGPISATVRARLTRNLAAKRSGSAVATPITAAGFGRGELSETKASGVETKTCQLNRYTATARDEAVAAHDRIVGRLSMTKPIRWARFPKELWRLLLVGPVAALTQTSTPTSANPGARGEITFTAQRLDRSVGRQRAIWVPTALRPAFSMRGRHPLVIMKIAREST